MFHGAPLNPFMVRPLYYGFRVEWILGILFALTRRSIFLNQFNQDQCTNQSISVLLMESKVLGLPTPNCPKCRQRSWKTVSNAPAYLGELGSPAVMQRRDEYKPVNQRARFCVPVEFPSSGKQILTVILPVLPRDLERKWTTLNQYKQWNNGGSTPWGPAPDDRQLATSNAMPMATGVAKRWPHLTSLNIALIYYLPPPFKWIASPPTRGP